MVGLPPQGTRPKTVEQRAIWSPVLPSNPMGSLEEVALGRLIHRPPILAREVMLYWRGEQAVPAYTGYKDLSEEE